MTRSGTPRRLQLVELVFEQPKALPLDERTKQIDVVGAGKLGPQLGGEGGLVARVRHERGVGERCRWPRQWGYAEGVGRRHSVETLDTAGRALVEFLCEDIVRKNRQDSADKFDSRVGTAYRAQRPFDDGHEVSGDRQRLFSVIDRFDLGSQVVTGG